MSILSETDNQSLMRELVCTDLIVATGLQQKRWDILSQLSASKPKGENVQKVELGKSMKMVGSSEWYNFLFLSESEITNHNDKRIAMQ